MPLGEIANLQVNDVISLNKKISDDLVVEVETIPFFRAKLGELGEQKAIKLIGVKTTADE